MKALSTLLKYFKNYKRNLIIGFFFILLSNVFATAIPSIVRETVDGLDSLGSSKFYASYVPDYFHTPLKFAILGGLLIFVCAVLKGVSMYFMRMKLIIMSRLIEYDQKNEIFKHYQKMGQGFYSKNYTGDLMNRISDDVSKVRMFTGPAIMYSINLSVMIVAVVGMMFYVNPRITFFVLIPLPILAIAIYWVSDTMNKKSDLIQQKLSTITSYVQETFSGIQVLKSYAAEKEYSRDFDHLNEGYKEDNMALVKINGIFMPAVMGLVSMSILITLYVGGNAVADGTFTLGNIVEYIIYVNMLTWPVASLGYVTSLVQRGAASQKRIDEFLSFAPDEDAGQNVISELEEGIEFRDVWFKYPETDTWVLENINFTIQKNTKFGIIGTTGSGKSTIAKLIMGIYRPTQGEILIDGKPIESYSKKGLSYLLGYVSQDIFLFSETLSDNILFGSNSISDEKNLKMAIESAALTSEIESFPKGLETMLGERGITLSGGQKQRTAIARALIKNPKILLIDDGLSAVDTKTEVDIKNSLNNWNQEQTFINISHRISSIQDSYEIIFLDNGKIVEKGKHTELVHKEGVYARLYEKQMALSEAP